MCDVSDWLTVVTAIAGFGLGVGLTGCETDPPRQQDDAGEERSPRDTATDSVDTGVDSGPPPSDSGATDSEELDTTDGGVEDGSEVDTQPSVASIEITLSGPLRIEKGTTERLTAQTKDASGSEQPCPGTIAWSSADTSIASIDASVGSPSEADVSGDSVGSTTVEATCDGVTDSISVEVEPALPQSLQDPDDLAFWLEPKEMIAKTGNPVADPTIEDWPDKSANGLDFTGGSDSSGQPGYVSQAIAGYPAARFTGGDEDLNTVNRKQNYVQSGTVTAFFVVKNRDGSHLGQVLSSCGVGNNQIRFDGAADSLYVHASNFYRDESFSGLAVPTTQWHVLTVVLGSSEIVVRQNGSVSAQTSADQTSGTWEFNQIGNRCSSEDLKADLTEVLVYDTELSESDRRRVETYLMDKFGL